ncbi:hypothetical protein ACLXBB_29400, partial [Pseudomonas aeruginosa]
ARLILLSRSIAMSDLHYWNYPTDILCGVGALERTAEALRAGPARAGRSGASSGCSRTLASRPAGPGSSCFHGASP